MSKTSVRFLIAMALLGASIQAVPADFAGALANGRLEEALQAADPLLRADSGNPRLWMARGIALRVLGRHACARREPYGAAGLSLLYREATKVGDAIALLREKLKRAPTDYRLNYPLSDTLMRKEGEMDAREADQARLALQRSIRHKPDFAKSHAALGKLYWKASQPDKAADEFRRAVELDPADRMVLDQMTLALRKFGRVEQARHVAVQLRAAVESDGADEIRNNCVMLK